MKALVGTFKNALKKEKATIFKYYEYQWHNWRTVAVVPSVKPCSALSPPSHSVPAATHTSSGHQPHCQWAKILRKTANMDLLRFLGVHKYGKEFKENVFPAENSPMFSMHGKCPDCCLQPSYCRSEQNMSSRILVWT